MWHHTPPSKTPQGARKNEGEREKKGKGDEEEEGEGRGGRISKEMSSREGIAKQGRQTACAEIWWGKCALCGGGEGRGAGGGGGEGRKKKRKREGTGNNGNKPQTLSSRLHSQ